VGPGDLQAIMAVLPRPHDAAILVGTETGDDAAVYRLDDERALVLTADFITPVCDDPLRYGEIAAANALSDVFAMGGRPLSAVALCCFPRELELEVATEILAGGQRKTEEAGAFVLGGHTVRNDELFYGLAVTGLCHPDRILRNVGARPGDALVLTKALGTGLIINGRRKGLGEDAHLEAALSSMSRLNRVAAEAALALGAHAATDVTGFGLSGHALKMALGSGVVLRLEAGDLPLLDGAIALAAAGVTTRSTSGNRAATADHLRVAAPSTMPLFDALLHDPQTSGGLLVALPEAAVAAFIEAVAPLGPAVARIGEVLAARPSAPAGLEVVGDFSRFVAAPA
jgi:selenide,water dikinase